MNEAAKFGLKPFHPVMAMIAVAASKALPKATRPEKVRFAIAVRDEIVDILARKALGQAAEEDLLEDIPNAPDGASLFQVTSPPWKREIEWDPNEQVPEAEAKLREAAAGAGQHWKTLEERQAAQRARLLVEETAKAVLGACEKAKIVVELWKDEA